MARSGRIAGLGGALATRRALKAHFIRAGYSRRSFTPLVCGSIAPHSRESLLRRSAVVRRATRRLRVSPSSQATCSALIERGNIPIARYLNVFTLI